MRSYTNRACPMIHVNSTPNYSLRPTIIVTLIVAINFKKYKKKLIEKN